MTKRQYEIALLVAQGLRNKAIAFQLGVTVGTVKMHLHTIYAATGITNRTELALAVADAETAVTLNIVED